MGNDPSSEARSALQRQHGVELSNAVENLAHLCERVHVKVSDHRERGCLPGTVAREPRRPFFVNLAILFEEVRKRETPFSSNRSVQNKQDMKLAKEMVRHATAAYLGSKGDIALLLQGIREEDVYYTYSPVLSRCPPFYVAYDENAKAVVVSIRGDNTAVDSMEHCIAPTIGFCGGYAHQDLLEKSQQLLNVLAPVVQQLFANATFSGGLVFTGHGTGGGVATLAALALLALESPFNDEFAVKRNEVRCVVFGAPPVFAPVSIVPRRVHDRILSVVHGMDIVPRLCLGTISKLLLAIRRLDDLDLSLYNRESEIKYYKISHTEVVDAVAVPFEHDHEFGSLYHVGTIIGLFFHNDKWNAHLYEPEHLNHILLHKHMMTDHLVEAYEHAMGQSYEHHFAPRVVEVENRRSVCC